MAKTKPAPDRVGKPAKSDRAPAGHEYLGQSKHFGGSMKAESGGDHRDGLAEKAKNMKFIGG